MRNKAFVLALCLSSLMSTGSWAEEEDCTIPSGVRFLPDTSAPTNRAPPFPAGQQFPSHDCDFYRWAWQTFLYVTNHDSGKIRPRFLEYSTFENVFKVPHSPLFATPNGGLLTLAPRTIQYPNDPNKPPDPQPTEVGDLEQAVSQEVLIDLRGYPIWYQIHLNPTL